jgi:type I restriction enzyme S subunit
VGGGTPSKALSANFTGAIPFMTVKDMKARFVDSTVDHISEDAISASATTMVPADTLIVATRMSLGKIVRPKVAVAINQDLKALFLGEGVEKTFIEYFWRSKSQAIQAIGTGTTVKGIRLEDIRALAVPLAPKNEQKRIADKLDTVLTRVDAINTRLARAAPLLKRFRQSVLAAATSGRLTEDWRATKDLPPMTEQALTATRLQSGCSKKDARITGELIERGCHLSPNKLIPPTWIGTCIGMSGVVSNGSTPSRSEPSYWGGAIPWVSSGEVRNNRIGATKESISQLGFESSSVKLLPVGSVLVAMIGEGKTRGQSGLLDIAATINQNVAAVTPNEALIESEYLWFWFQSQYEANREAGNGTGPQALNCQKVRELPLNLPPLQEQVEIVRRVETLFAFADRLEARLQTAQTAANRLTPALLAKAFRGELVPQDPNDEPASELLKRLAGSAPVGGIKRGRKRTSDAST